METMRRGGNRQKKQMREKGPEDEGKAALFCPHLESLGWINHKR